MADMTEHSITFTAPDVRALLDGRKHMTRRVVTPQPAPFVQVTPDVHEQKHPAPYIDCYCGQKKTVANPRGMGLYWCWWTRDDRQGLVVARCPFGVPGDELWVKETIRADDPGNPDSFSYYTADGAPTKADCWPWKRPVLSAPFTPRGLSRITLRVTDVRVERLQDISEADARAEGMETIREELAAAWEGVGGFRMGGECREHFRDTWDSMHAKHPERQWKANPWVFVLSFSVVDLGGFGSYNTNRAEDAAT